MKKYIETAKSWGQFYKNALVKFNVKDLFSYEKIVEQKAKALSVYKDIVYKLDHIIETNYNLGLYHLDRGNLRDAVIRFNFALFLDKSLYKAHIWLCKCYMQQGKTEKAMKHLQLYKTSGDQALKFECEYYNKLLTNKLEDVVIPNSLVAIRFNQIATKEEREGSHENDIFKSLKEYVHDNMRPYGNKMLDLGCGKGEIGKLCVEAKLVNAIVGVDISQLMLKHANKQEINGEKVYNEIYNTNIQEFFQRTGEQSDVFDIIMLSDVVTYSLEVLLCFEKAKALLDSNGVLVISFRLTEDSDNKCEFEQGMEMFYFSKEYIMENATGAGLTCVEEKDFVFEDGDKAKVLLLKK